MADLQFGPMLGEGAYGQVFLARHRVLPDRWYAVKRQQLNVSMRSSGQGKHHWRLLEREREVLLLLARESRGKADINLFVQLVAHGQDSACLQLAMTAVLGGELFHLLQETGAMSEADVQFYAANLVMALQHLHSRGIAYRDLKGENVLLSGGFTHAAAGWPVLADFGLANWVQQDGLSLQTFCGTPAFMAPEVAAQNGHGTAADWWSLGVLLYQCLTLRTPFEGPTAHATIENVIHGRRVQVPASSLSEGARDIIDALLHQDPAERLGGPLRGDPRTHPFFWGFDFTQVEKRRMTPPHAVRCRARAVAATRHPSLRLPTLPELDPGPWTQHTRHLGPHTQLHLGGVDNAGAGAGGAGAGAGADAGADAGAGAGAPPPPSLWGDPNGPHGPHAITTTLELDRMERGPEGSTVQGPGAVA